MQDIVDNSSGSSSLTHSPTHCCCGWMAKLAVERTLPHSQEHSSYSLLPKETKNNKITILKHSLSVFCLSPLLIWGVNLRSGSSQLISLSGRLFQFLKRRSSATNDLPLLLQRKEFFCSLISISLHDAARPRYCKKWHNFYCAEENCVIWEMKWQTTSSLFFFFSINLRTSYYFISHTTNTHDPHSMCLLSASSSG